MNKLVLSILNKLPVKESFDLIKRLMSVKDKNYDDILAKTVSGNLIIFNDIQF